MAEVIPLKATKSGSTPTGLGEFETGDTLPPAVVPPVPTVINTAQTAAYTFILTDAGCCTPFNLSAAANATIPTNASVAFPIGTALYVRQQGSAAVTLVGDTGVTLNSSNGAVTSAVGDWRAALKISADEWDVL